jgi:hypothetical protein
METSLVPADMAPVAVVSSALARADDPGDVLKIRDFAALKEKYERQIRQADEEIRKWQRVKLAAERKLGELIRRHVRPGNPPIVPR